MGERSTVHRSRCVSTSWKQWRWRCVVDRNQTTTTAKEDKLVVLRATAAGWYPRTFDVGRSMVETRLAAKLNPNVRRRSYVGISGCCFSGGWATPPNVTSCRPVVALTIAVDLLFHLKDLWNLNILGIIIPSICNHYSHVRRMGVNACHVID